MAINHAPTDGMVTKETVCAIVHEKMRELPDLVGPERFGSFLQDVAQGVQGWGSLQGSSDGELHYILISSSNAQRLVTSSAALQVLKNEEKSTAPQRFDHLPSSGVSTAANQEEFGASFDRSPESPGSQLVTGSPCLPELPKEGEPKSYDCNIGSDDSNMDSDTDSDFDGFEDPDPKNILPGVDVPELFKRFTLYPNPSFDDCERMAAYFEVLMKHAPYYLRPTTEDFQNAKLEEDENTVWYYSEHLPDWKQVTGKDFEPLWDLLIAAETPNTAALHEVEARIMDPWYKGAV